MSDKEERQIRLLLAILGQKCFQDAWSRMKWAEVARHPLLSEDNVNAHAIRMRYSRISKKFKPKTIEPTFQIKHCVSKTKKDLPRTLSVDIEGAAEISNESDVDGPEPREDQPEQLASGLLVKPPVSCQNDYQESQEISSTGKNNTVVLSSFSRLLVDLENPPSWNLLKPEVKHPNRPTSDPFRNTMFTPYLSNALNPDTYRDGAPRPPSPPGSSLDTLTWQPGFSLTTELCRPSKPPDLRALTCDERSSPPQQDFDPSNGDVPYMKEPRFKGDLFTPEWIRGIGESRQFWCG